MTADVTADGLDLRTGVIAILLFEGWGEAEIDAVEGGDPHSCADECEDEYGKSVHPLRDRMDELAQVIPVALDAMFAHATGGEPR